MVGERSPKAEFYHLQNKALEGSADEDEIARMQSLAHHRWGDKKKTTAADVPAAQEPPPLPTFTTVVAPPEPPARQTAVAAPTTVMEPSRPAATTVLATAPSGRTVLDRPNAEDKSKCECKPELDKIADLLSNILAKTGVATASAAPAAAPAATAAGGMGAMLKGAGVMAAVALVQHAASTVAAGFDTFNNSLLTGAMKTERIVESIPVVGGLVKAFRELGDAASGLTDRMRMMHVNFDVRAARMQQSISNQARTDPMRFESMQAENRALELTPGRMAAIDIGSTARNTALEQVQYREAQALAGPREALARAEAERAAAQRTAERARSRTEISTEFRQRAEGRLNPIERDIRSVERTSSRRATVTVPLESEAGASLPAQVRGGGGARYRGASEQREVLGNLLRQQGDAELEVTRVREGNLPDITQQRQAELTLAQATMAVDQQRLAIGQAELSNLRAREQSHRATSQTLGALTPGGRLMALQHLRHIQERGLEATPLAMRESVRRFAPEEVASRERQAFERSSEGEEFQRRLPGQFMQGGLEAGQQQIDQLQQRMMEQSREASARHAQSFATALNTAFEGITTALAQTVTDSENRVMRQVRQTSWGTR